MHIFEIAIWKFVPSFGVLRKSFVDAENPFCLLAESIQADKRILCLR